MREQRGAFVAAGEFEHARHAEAKARDLAERGGVVPLRIRAAVRIRGILVRGQREQFARFACGRGKERDAVERAACRHDTGRRQQPLGAFQADEIVQRRGHAAGAGRIGAERKGRDAERHRQRRSRTRPARRILRQYAIAALAVRRARAVETRRELIEIRLAERNCAERNQLSDERRRLRGRVGERGARGGGRDAGEVDVVLQRERNAVQRQRVDIRRCFQRGEIRLEFRFA